MEENSSFLRRVGFSIRCSIPLRGAIHKQNCTICDTDCVDNIYESRQSCSLLIARSIKSPNVVEGLCVFDKSLLLQTGTKRLYRGIYSTNFNNIVLLWCCSVIGILHTMWLLSENVRLKGSPTAAMETLHRFCVLYCLHISPFATSFTVVTWQHKYFAILRRPLRSSSQEFVKQFRLTLKKHLMFLQ